MKTKNFFSAMLAVVSMGVFAQDRTTVTATSNDISENLDLRAVASIFGDSRDLEDFENRLNDPRTQISNLDLNGDYQVDYLRVVENVDGYTHLIIVQAVLGRDTFQDVATIEVERDRYNNVQVQVVGDVYMYGPNYIYEPVYVSRPVFFVNFWGGGYRPYCSSWYWGYYPTYFVAWRPMPVFRYANHIHVHINNHHHYNYVNVRRSTRAVAMHTRYRTNGYETRNPDRSFAVRNKNVRNAYDLQSNTRNTGGVRSANVRNSGTRSETGGIRSAGTRKNEGLSSTGGVRNSGNVRGNATTKSESVSTGGTRNNQNTGGVRSNGNIRNNGGSTKYESGGIRSNSNSGVVRNNGGVRSQNADGVIRSNNSTKYESGGVRNNSNSGVVRNNGTVRSQSPSRSESTVRSGNQRQASAPSRQFEQRQPSVRSEAPRSNDRSFAQQRGGGARESSAPRGNGGQSRGGGQNRGGEARR